MYDILPEDLLTVIRDRYVAGVADAEAEFGASSEDEDTVTGALGQAISSKGPQVFYHGAQTYVWQVSYKKIRGRGAGAPEKRLGADGIFQIRVSDAAGNTIRTKGLPFQCKKGWQGADPKLGRQAGNMVTEAGDGIVIDYTPEGYTACSAAQAVQAEGNRRSVDGMKPLGQMLGNDFLECRRGKVGLAYNPEQGAFGHVISTEVTALHRE